MRESGPASCPLCSGRAVVRWPTAEVWRCRSCGLLFRHPIPRLEALEELYAASWSAPMLARAETGGTDERLARCYTARLLQSLGLADFNGRRIIELGAGRGEMLTALRERGADARGVEPFGYEFLRQRNFAVYRSLEDLPSGLLFDGAVSLDVVEHLVRPWHELAVLGRRLRPGGFLYLSTLNTRGLNALLTRSRWRELHKGGHLLFFNAASMRCVLSSAGYERVRRLRWHVAYHDNAFRRAIDFVLQSAGLDGGLRFLARTAGGSAG